MTRRTNPSGRSIRSATASALVLAAAISAPATRAEYAVVDLGALTNPTTGSSSVGGVNLGAQVAFTNSPDATAARAFRYAADATLNLGTLGGADAAAIGINNAGQIVGRSKTAAGVTHAYLWTPGDTTGVPTNPQMKDINPSGGNSEATAINASGQVAGYVTVRVGISNQDHAFVYSGGVLKQLPLPTGGGYTYSYAYGINDAGKVVGEAYTAFAPQAHGFIYNGTTSSDIGDFGGGSSSPTAINNSDHVVGYSANADGYDRAFIYANGVMSDIGSLGGHYTYALAVNNKDQIAGGSFTDDLDTVYHGFVSDGTTMTDLNAKVTSKAADWVLGAASGINDNGVIVGTGTLSGARHGYMLVPLAQGDANADGAVDFLDLAALAQNYNTTGTLTWEQGDFNGDGSVDFLDLAELAQNYNTTQGTFAQAVDAAFAAVPEPAAPLFPALAGAFSLFRRRTASKRG